MLITDIFTLSPEQTSQILIFVSFIGPNHTRKPDQQNQNQWRGTKDAGHIRVYLKLCLFCIKVCGVNGVVRGVGLVSQQAVGWISTSPWIERFRKWGDKKNGRSGEDEEG